MGPSDVQSRQGGGAGQGQLRQPGGVPEAAAATRACTASPQRRNDESWVEISSQPSSSSLSSIGDEIVTTGLRIGSNSYPTRRRRLQQHQQQQQQQPMPPSCIISPPTAHAGTSSQEEYDETESEEDRVMTSSTEQIHPAIGLPRQQTAVRSAREMDTDSDDDDDGDENATALGRPSSSPVFRPQPNAFSHPPSHLTHRHSTSSAHPYHQSQPRPSMHTRSHTRPHRASPNYMSPAYQADNDAALRASLTTLLSCAAAARGLPKRDDMHSGPSGVGAGIGAAGGILPSSQPMELRLVPESELMGESRPPGAATAPPAKVPLRTASNSSAPSAPTSTSSREPPEVTTDKGKRAASTQSKPLRATKKKRTGSSSAVDGETSVAAPLISPTLLTWVVSAGVVVLVSVVGFGAGYVIGREVGRQEGAMSLGSAAAPTSNASAASCGRELVRSTSGGTLRRFRWGSVGKSVTA
ncbi:hypothetical protein B0T17DRAFT_211522 [Bombardia bombarda]|uniref:Uncharacterized protein n=1 Tax=Bombardia bombarda TaxID=252184 RepID=A0AA40CA54_9PEZI|nr:hypothetical protein B0T17DRAFT_211522 [Bombardia bombarda]